MTALARQTLSILRLHRRGLLIFHLFFAGLAVALVTPAFSMALAVLEPVTGHAAISAGGLLQFLTSPGGLLWVAMTLMLAALLGVLQQAGMLLIAASPGHSEYRIVLVSLWGVMRRVRRLFVLTVIQVVAHGLLALPFLAAIGLAYQQWLLPYDAYYLRLERPLELWWFAGIAGVALLGAIIVNGWLYLRWMLAVPMVVLDNRPVKAALGESARLVRGQRLPAVTALLTGFAAVVALPIVAALVFRVAGGQLLLIAPATMGVLLPLVLLCVALYILVTISLAFLGVAAYSVLVYAIYRRATGKHSRPKLQRLPGRAGPLAWSAEALLIALALAQGWLVVQSFDFPDDVTVTAHRGNAVMAPENTRSAIERAIEDGADYVEIDVRMTADGTPVLWHDADMKRVFGREGKISDITYEEALSLDAGAWFGAEFEGERILSLEQAISITRGRVGLYVDIKPDRDTPSLTRDTVALLQQHNALDGTVVAAADALVLNEVKRLEPSLKTALLAQFIVGSLPGDAYDILGLRQNRVSAAAVAKAHHAGHELHVWTVNRPEAMTRFIDMGVDNIITDRPDVLVELLQRRSAMSDTELFVTKLRSWLQ